MNRHSEWRRGGASPANGLWRGTAGTRWLSPFSSVVRFCWCCCWYIFVLELLPCRVVWVWCRSRRIFRLRTNFRKYLRRHGSDDRSTRVIDCPRAKRFNFYIDLARPAASSLSPLGLPKAAAVVRPFDFSVSVLIYFFLTHVCSRISWKDLWVWWMYATWSVLNGNNGVYIYTYTYETYTMRIKYNIFFWHGLYNF